MTLPHALWIVAAYLCGSIPFALLIGLAKGVDIRQRGSGNVGATNCGRTLGKKYGIACLILDTLKGLGPVLGAGFANGWIGREDLTATEASIWLAAAAAAVLGHVFPVWLKFKGGKGVATSLGVVMGFWPTLTIPGLVGLGVWLVVVLIWRIIGLASVAAAVALPVALVVITLTSDQSLGERLPFIVVTVLLAAVVIIRHRTNLTRLLAGKEEKIGEPDNPD